MFTVSLVTVYVTYLAWTSLASVPDAECNPFTLSVGNTIAQIVVGIVFTFCTVLSVATASQTNAETGQQITTSAGAGIVAEKVDDEAAQKDPELEEAAFFPVTTATMVF